MLIKQKGGCCFALNAAFKALIAATILFFCCASPAFSNESKSYTLGLLPQEPALAMYERWLPFVELLAKKAGIHFEIKVFDHVAEFEHDLFEGKFDFAYLNSTQEAVAWNVQGYIPLVRSRKLFRGAIFVPADSPIHSIKQLKGQDVAFVTQRSICSVVLRHELTNNKEVGDYRIVYAGSSSNVYKNVLLGKTVAGGTLDVSLANQPREIISQLRPIYYTPLMAPHPIAAHPRVSQQEQEKVTQTVLTIAQEKGGKNLLRNIRMPPPLVEADYFSDYKWLEKYMID